MPKKSGNAKDPAALRREAEARLLAKKKDQLSTPPQPKPAENASRALHELEVHQIELEMQNNELEQARDELEALLEKYTDLYDFAPVGYLTLDRAGKIREANLTAATLLRLPRSGMVNRNFALFIQAADRPAFAAFQEKVFASHIQQSCELSLALEKGLLLDVELKAIAFDSGQACRMTLADTTERKRADADRLVLNKLESTGNLAGGIAHDFNNLLSIILLNVDLAQAQPSGEESAAYLDEVKKSVISAQTLTSQLVTFAEGGAPVLSTMFLSGVVRDSVRLALAGSQLRCDFSLPEDLWAASVDPGQIGQVVRNVVLNARESMPGGGVISVNARNTALAAGELSSLPAGDYVQLSILDHGGGIPEVILSKIFDPYFSTKQRGNQKGMGLGLTICHSVVTAHHEAISVKSTAGAGTIVRIFLPGDRNWQSSGNTVPATSCHRAARVLVMDDELNVRKVIGMALELAGHEVELADEGQGAVDLYTKARKKERAFDVVILDLTVREGLGGVDALQAMLRIDPSVKGIAMSGYALDPVLRNPSQHGFKFGLAKPFDVATLREMVSRVMSDSPEGKGAI